MQQATEEKRWVFGSLALLGLISAFVLHKLLFAVFGAVGIRTAMIMGKLPVTMLLGLGLAGAGLAVLLKKTMLEAFSTEVLRELSRVSWPTRKETWASTVVVLVVVFFFGIYLGICDLLWAKVLQLVL